MTAPILKGSQPEQAAKEQERADRAVKQERLAWWQLEESARRCIAISEHLWDGRLAAAISAQRQLAETLRDRTSEGTRADGVTKYEIDRGVMVPVFVPRDRLEFLARFATTLLISARQQGLPVTVEGTKRETDKADGAGEAAEAGSAADETDGDREAQELAQAGESAPLEAGGLAVSEAPAS